MSYKVLARKWRPQHFNDMLGQEAVLRALVNALDSNRLHHAYLFTGMRGVGKTTIARIFAKCLNCETAGISANPCGECSACKDIEAGRFFDLIEVDAASRTKVEETRELLENVPYAPASGRYKVYLIDEVHMFSNHSFNALLKTLEEPPEHVKFLLATTDPQKVPVTVLSRCLQFNLRRMPTGVLADYLSSILDKESIDHERAALELIAKASEGSVRDSLSLVEQAAAFGSGAVIEQAVESMLGRVSTDRLLSLIATLIDGNLDELFSQIRSLAEFAPDFMELMGELTSLFHQIAMLQSVPGSLNETTPGFDHIKALANQVAPDEVQMFYQIGTHARRDMPFAPDQQEAFEMAMLRMSIFRPQGDAGSVASQPDNDANRGKKVNVETDDLHPRGSSPTPTAGNGSAALPVRGEVSAGGALRAEALKAARGELPDPPVIKPTEAAVDTIPAVTQSEPTRVSEPQVATVDTLAAATKSKVTDPQNPEVPSQSAPNVVHHQGARFPLEELSPTSWPELVKQLDVSGMPRQLATNTSLLKCANKRVELLLEAGSEHLNTPRFAERLRNALETWFGHEMELHIALSNEEIITPAKLDEQKRATQLEEARIAINKDPVVQTLIDRVDASIDETSVRLLAHD